MCLFDIIDDAVRVHDISRGVGKLDCGQSELETLLVWRDAGFDIVN